MEQGGGGATDFRKGVRIHADLQATSTYKLLRKGSGREQTLPCEVLWGLHNRCKILGPVVFAHALQMCVCVSSSVPMGMFSFLEVVFMFLVQKVGLFYIIGLVLGD